MKKWLRRSALLLLTVLIAAGLTYHLGLRNWCLRWGTTHPRPHDCRSRSAPAVLCDGRSGRLGKPASWEAGSDSFLELHLGTSRKWGKPSDRASAWWNAAYPHVACRRKIVLGADALRHGAEDAPHHPRSVRARVTTG